MDELFHDYDMDLTIIFEYFECHMECLVTQRVYLGNDEFAGRQLPDQGGGRMYRGHDWVNLLSTGSVEASH